MLLPLLLAAAFTVGPSQTIVQEPGSSLRVFLVTMGPGSEIYEKFGHNAIWIRDPERNTDIAYNWGEFSFDQPGFYTRFLQGRMLYEMAGHTMSDMLYVYRIRNRAMYTQELNLTPAQKRELQRFVEWNALPENKDYRYDYYRDNCSTRVRDVLDRALGGALKRALQPIDAGTTYRFHTARLMHDQNAALTGMNLAMGPAIDQPLNLWEEAFIPMELQEAVRTVKVLDANGVEVPLVLSEQTLLQTDRAPLPNTIANRLPGRLLIGLFIAAVLLLFGSLRAGWSRAVFRILAIVWTLIIGLLGTVIGLLWAFTDHYVTYRNENLLQANPMALVLCVALIMLLVGSKRSAKLAVRTALFLAGLSMLGLIVQLLPGLDQVNADIIALLLPAHMALAWVISRPHAVPAATSV